MREGGVTIGSPQEPRARSTPEQKETPPVRKKSTETGEESGAEWETLEAFARQAVQRLSQRMLEE